MNKNVHFFDDAKLVFYFEICLQNQKKVAIACKDEEFNMTDKTYMYMFPPRQKSPLLQQPPAQFVNISQTGL